MLGVTGASVRGDIFVSICHLLRINADNDLMAVVCRCSWRVLIMEWRREGDRVEQRNG
jgi:hypothetical protein